MESRWGRELMVGSSLYSPWQILSDETPGEEVGILTYYLTGVVGSELREKQWSKILSLAAINV